MNWKKWVGLLGLLLFLGPRHAFADSYQLAITSWTTNNITVSSFSWTQVDTPQLSGRTSVTIYNLDTSSPVFCRQDGNSFLPLTGIQVSSNTSQITGVPIAPVAYGATASSIPSYLTLSLSNFASNRGAYPVSATLPVYCVSAKYNASGSVVVQQSF